MTLQMTEATPAPATIPTDLVPLIDGDILRYEVGFGAETGWNAITEGEDNIPPFRYVEKVLLQRLEYIKAMVNTKATPRIFITEGRTFRDKLAITKPYKGTRKAAKPWHFNNLSLYLTDVLGCEVVRDIEADDAMAIEQVAHPGTTIICSRDKDLRQVPGWFFSWELGRQPSFGPHLVADPGTIELSEDRKKLVATGLASFYGQILTGDRVDNIPGLDKCGPVAAYRVVEDYLYHREVPLQGLLDEIREMYGDDEYLLEQGRLVWMTRRLHPDGTPVLWEIGMEN